MGTGLNYLHVEGADEGREEFLERAYKDACVSQTYGVIYPRLTDRENKIMEKLGRRQQRDPNNTINAYLSSPYSLQKLLDMMNSPEKSFNFDRVTGEYTGNIDECIYHTMMNDRNDSNRRVAEWRIYQAVGESFTQNGRTVTVDMIDRLINENGLVDIHPLNKTIISVLAESYGFSDISQQEFRELTRRVGMKAFKGTCQGYTMGIPTFEDVRQTRPQDILSEMLREQQTIE